MRGAIINALQGFSVSGNPPVNGYTCTAQETMFWMWRVSAITITSSIVANFVEGDDQNRMDFSNLAVAPKNNTPPYIMADEEDQMLVRRQYAPARSDPEDEYFYDLDFGARVQTNPDLNLWRMFLIFEGAPGAQKFPTITTVPNNNPTSAILQVRAEDSILHRIYLHTLPLYLSSPSSSVSSVTGRIEITPSEYYPWRDRNGVPLYG